MKRLVALLLILSLSTTFTAYAATGWSKQAAKLRNGIVLIHFIVLHEVAGAELEGQASCTGIVIDHKAGIVLTADHCIPKGDYLNSLTVDDKIHIPQLATVVFENSIYDTAIIKVQTLEGKTDIEPRSTVVVMGMPIMAGGYGYGLKDYLIKVGVVSHPYLSVDDNQFPQGLIADFPFIPGMSGGPVVDDQGKLVGMVDASSELIGYAIDLRVLTVLVGKYFPSARAQTISAPCMECRII